MASVDWAASGGQPARGSAGLLWADLVPGRAKDGGCFSSLLSPQGAYWHISLAYPGGTAYPGYAVPPLRIPSDGMPPRGAPNPPPKASK